MSSNNVSAIKLTKQVKFLRGMAYGIHQPTLVGEIQAGVTSEVSIPRILKILESQLLIELHPQLGEVDSPGRQLALLILHLHLAFQQEAKLPVISTPFSISVQEAAELRLEAQKILFAAPYIFPNASIHALSCSIRIVNACVSSGPDSNCLTKIGEVAARCRAGLRQFGIKGLNTLHFMSAALNQSIPVHPLVKNTIAFGHGENCRWLDSSLTSDTPVLGVAIANNKYFTTRLLREFGLPVPQNVLVKSSREAIHAARRLGYPVVVKPIDQERGDGVFSGLGNDSAVDSAFQAAKEFSSSIMVERHIPGEDYRFTVWRDRVVKVIHRRPGGVVGDGVHTIWELFNAYQSSAKAKDIVRREGKPRLVWDSEADELLEEQNLSRDSVPQSESFVPLRRKCNISAGGTYQVLALDSIHPDNLKMAIRVAQALDLDLAGVDILSTDVSAPWYSSGAKICEVNSKPQIGIRETPEIYSQILLDLVPNLGRIPAYAVIAVGAMAEQIRSDSSFKKCLNTRSHGSKSVGLSCKEGVWLNGEQQVWNSPSSFDAANSLLLDRRVEMAVVVLDDTDVISSGLPTGSFDRIFLLCPDSSETNGAELSIIQTIELMTAPYGGAGRLTSIEQVATLVLQER